MTAWAVLLLSAASGVSVHYTDIIEVNKMYGRDGAVVLEQLIWWDWCYEKHAYHVRDWRMRAKCPDPVERVGGWSVKWKEEGITYDVRSSQLSWTHTFYDPEMLDRQPHPEAERKKIRAKVNK